jgi:hypothetical protein
MKAAKYYNGLADALGPSLSTAEGAPARPDKSSSSSSLVPPAIERLARSLYLRALKLTESGTPVITRSNAA